MTARPRILVVEPNEEDRALVQQVLGRHCHLYYDDDPLHTFDLLDVFEPDLLILELRLPSLSGFELINLIQDHDPCRAIPIMVFSQIKDLESQKLAYRLGAMHFQVKPCRPSQLFKAAAMFWRLAANHNPMKRHSLDEVDARLAERLSAHQINPLVCRAVAAYGQRPHGLVRAKGQVKAHVTAGRPR